MYIPLFLMLVTVVASTVGTISGFGISTIMIPLLANYYALTEVLLFVALIHLANDVWKLILFYEGIRWRVLAYFGAAGLIGSVVGALLAIRIGVSPFFLQLFGVFLMAYAIFLIIRPSFSLRGTGAGFMIGGGLSGFTYGLFGMGGLLRSTALISLHLDKAVYLATNGAIALLVDIARVVVYRASGMSFGKEFLIGILFCVPLSFIGAKLGEKVVRFIPQKTFRLMIIGFIIVMGLKLALKL